jgi:flagellar secretion chaperone FliS
MSQNAINAYRKTRATTATPAQLIGMLYDALLVSLQRAVEALEEDRRMPATEQLVRSQRLVTELRCSLNFEAGELSRNLDNIYEYVWKQLVAANVSRDAGSVASCVSLIAPLRRAWAEACLGEGTGAQPRRMSA